MMLKIVAVVALLLSCLFPSLADAQFRTTDCNNVPAGQRVTDLSSCNQSTTAGGRSVGTLYLWNGSAWVSMSQGIGGLAAHEADTTAIHGITDTSKLTTNAAALTANLPVIGAGSNGTAVGTRSGNTTAFVTTTGAQTSGDCVTIDANGNHVPAGAACGSGSGYTDEQAQDAVGAILTDSGTIDFTYDDAGNTITGIVIPDSIGPTQVNETADFNFSGQIAKQDIMDASSFCLDAGSTDAYACDLAPAITAYVTGTRYRFKANTANTGAATLQLNSIPTPVAIKKAIGSLTVDLSTGDIIAGQWVDVVYNGTNFQLQSPTAAPQRFYNANAASAGIWVCDDAVPTNCGYIYYSASLGLQFVCAPGLVENACDYVRKLAAGKIGGWSDRNGTNIFTVTENNGSGIVKMVLGSDATGDIWYRDSSGNFTRLGIGGANTFLAGGGSVPAYAALPVGSTTVSGIAEAAIASEVTTGTDAARYVTPLALATSTIFGRKSVQMVGADFATNVAVGNGAFYLRIPPQLNGMNLVGVSANVVTAGTTNATTFQVTRCLAAATGNLCSGTTVSMLSTVGGIDSGENDTATAATPAVINISNDDVATGQILRLDVVAVSTTPPKGLIVNLEFQLP